MSWFIGQAIAEQAIERNLIGYVGTFVGTFTDITDRKQAEQALRKSEERFCTSIENRLDCFAIHRAV